MRLDIQATLSVLLGRRFGATSKAANPARCRAPVPHRRSRRAQCLCRMHDCRTFDQYSRTRTRTAGDPTGIRVDDRIRACGAGAAIVPIAIWKGNKCMQWWVVSRALPHCMGSASLASKTPRLGSEGEVSALARFGPDSSTSRSRACAHSLGEISLAHASDSNLGDDVFGAGCLCDLVPAPAATTPLARPCVTLRPSLICRKGRSRTALDCAWDRACC